MNRLTKKAQFVRNLITGKEIKYISNESDQTCVDKLGALEDIEEELGIDLVTLVKALNGLYYKFRPEDREISKMKVPMLRIINGEYCWICPKWMTTTWMSVLVKDYGKTWALTKEELEDETIL